MTAMKAIRKTLASLVLLPLPGALAVELVPVEHFAKLPDYYGAYLSPDAKHLALTVPKDDRRDIVILDISDPEQFRVVQRITPPNRESAREIHWATNERIVFDTVKQLGSLARPLRLGKLYAADIDGKRGKQIFGPRRGAANLAFIWAEPLHMLPDEPDDILVVSWAHDRERPLAERVDIYSGRRNIVAVSPLKRGGLLADHNGNVRFAGGLNDEFEQVIAFRPTADADWREFDHPFEGDILPVGISEDGSEVLVSAAGGDEMGLHAVDLETGDVSPLAVHERVELHYALPGLEPGTVVGARFLPGMPEYRLFAPDRRGGRLWAQLLQAFPEHVVNITSFSEDRRFAVIETASDVQPVRYYLLDTENLQARYLLDATPWLDERKMARKDSHWIETRDGMHIQVYVTRPRDAPPGPVPTIVMVHGGPHGPRDEWSFLDGSHREVQFLANRGYAVVQPNFRGSGGFGKEFLEAGYRKWGAEMQDDVTDTTLWAIEGGIADRDRTCIYGGSYGGYSTLAGITREPELYACAFAFVGVYDLELMYKKGDIQERKLGVAYLEKALGTDEDDLQARSPINFVHKIETPLYIAHGKKDVRAHVSHFYALRDRLKEAGVPFEEMLVSGEGHGFYELDNRIMYFETLAGFFDRHIGDEAVRERAAAARP